MGGRCLPLLSPAFAGRAQGAWQMRRVWVDLLLLPPAFLVPEANHLASMWVPLPALLKPRVMTEVPGLPHQIERQLGHFLSLVPLDLLASPIPFLVSSHLSPAWEGGGSPYCAYPLQLLWHHQSLTLEAVLPGSSQRPVASTPPLCHFPSIRGGSRGRGRVAKSLGRREGATV